MDFRLEFISRLFQKTSSKPIENYVLTRIWHKLDDVDIQMIPQQYVNRSEKKYALTDVFFPQIGLHIEVNEPAHYLSKELIQIDNERNQEITLKTGHKVEVIDCREPLAQIHKRIDEIVKYILDEVSNLKSNGVFKAWRPNESRDPNFWLAKNTYKETDDIIMPNIESICQLFGADPAKTKRGYLRRGAIQHPKLENVVIWWPSAISRSGWENKRLEGREIITESHCDKERNRKHFYSTTKNLEKRIVFYLEKDILGFLGYHFFGVYEIDSQTSNEIDGVYWRRISKEFNANSSI